ncbi:UNKNOWN [Stylonychia lemnae]|uniref:VPS9 domain-containing protein n=1 Tax=Stylonychia lemnae TaxID=5949 RepID=A0A078BE13_STYLE|nr:UNKNOWN [Stylonychia lemnae]|eukprot:CDW91387.1 UNKNOWN [Stylonychia lemnae]
MFCMSKNSNTTVMGSQNPTNFKLNKVQSKEWFYFIEQQLNSMSKDSKWTVILQEQLYDSLNMNHQSKYQMKIRSIYQQMMKDQASEELRQSVNIIQKTQTPVLDHKYHKRLFKEITMQINSEGHFFRVLNLQFHKFYTRQYRKYVLKKKTGEKISTIQDLSQKIEQATVRLRKDQWDQLSSDSQKEQLDINLSDKILGDVKKYIAIQLFAVLRFYMAAINQDQQVKEPLQEKIMAFVTKKILSGNVYKIALAMCRYETMTLEKRFRAQLRRLNKQQMTTQDLDICKYFLLNEQSQIKEIQRELLVKRTIKNQKFAINNEFDDLNDENDCNINDEDYFCNKPLFNEIQSTRSKTSGDSNHNNQNDRNNNISQKFKFKNNRDRQDTVTLLMDLTKEVETLQIIGERSIPDVEEIERRLRVSPYSKVIDKLRSIKDFENPLRKIKVIDEAKHCISECIDEFWKGLNLNQDNLMIDADQLVSIVTYSIIKSQMKDLPGQLKLIEEFTSVQVQNSKFGQALFTVKAATENIAHGILVRRMSSMTKLMRSITRGSNNNNDDNKGQQSYTIKNTFTMVECKDSENVSDDTGGHSFTNRLSTFTKQVTSKQAYRRGMTIYSIIDPFLTELEDYGQEIDGYNSLFSEEEDSETFEQLNTSANI